MTVGSAIRTLLLALLVAWAAGFALWVNDLPRASVASAPDADGVVALTGGGGARIATAVDLLKAGTGRRLLITGVDQRITEDQVRELAGADDALFECCIDLDWLAEDTKGNAAEVVRWARENGFQSLIVVTSDYHLPRSTLEIRRRADDLAIYAYPVASPAALEDGWWRKPQAIRLLMVEFTKYLVIAIIP